MFKLENNVPIPEPRSRAKAPNRKVRELEKPLTVNDFPVADMKVRQSFWVPPGTAVRFARNNLGYIAQRHGVALTTRVLSDGSLRVWRIPKRKKAA